MFTFGIIIVVLATFMLITSIVRTLNTRVGIFAIEILISVAIIVFAFLVLLGVE